MNIQSERAPIRGTTATATTLIDSPALPRPIQAAPAPTVHPDQFARLSFAEIKAMRCCSGSDWRVYCVLAFHCNDQQMCWPGRQRLARMTDLLPDHVSRALSRLEAQGLIVRSRNSRGTTLYTLPFHQPRSTPQLEKKTRLPKAVAPAAEALPESVDRTDHTFEQTRESSATPPPTPPESAPPKQEPTTSLSTPQAKTSPPNQVPSDWIDIGYQLRSELPMEIIHNSAIKFIDHYRARGITLVDWTPAWRNWIRRERHSQPAGSHKTPPSVPVPLSAEQRETAEHNYQALMKAADCAAEERRQRLLAEYGIVEATLTPRLATDHTVPTATGSKPVPEPLSRTDQQTEARLPGAVVREPIPSHRQTQQAEQTQVVKTQINDALQRAGDSGLTEDQLAERMQMSPSQIRGVLLTLMREAQVKAASGSRWVAL